MKNIITIIFVLVAFTGYSQVEYSTKKTGKFVRLIEKKNYKSIHQMFSDTLKKVITLESVEQIFTKLDRSYGEPLSIDFQTAVSYKQFVVYRYLYELKEAKLILLITLDQEEKVSGFRMLPNSKKLVGYKEPTSYGLEARKERKLSLKSPAGELEGILTLPVIHGNAPVVIFLHGSGPNDMDESVGNSKVFQDLALGLADSGIASYRFHKRTFSLPGSFNDESTLYDEVVEDALIAVSMLKRQLGVDSNRIYVMGHSLGAMSVPLVAQLDTTVAGIIMMSSPCDKLHNLLPRQIKYLKENTSQAISEEMVTNYENSAKLINSGYLSDTIPKSKLFGLSADYWNYLNNYDHKKVSLNITQPILLMNGSRDYQVDTIEFKCWEELFLDKENAITELIDGLNHLFISGTGKSVPEEYQVPGNMDIRAIKTIIKFIKIEEEY